MLNDLSKKGFSLINIKILKKNDIVSDGIETDLVDGKLHLFIVTLNAFSYCNFCLFNTWTRVFRYPSLDYWLVVARVLEIQGRLDTAVI